MEGGRRLDAWESGKTEKLWNIFLPLWATSHSLSPSWDRFFQNQLNSLSLTSPAPRNYTPRGYSSFFVPFKSRGLLYFSDNPCLDGKALFSLGLQIACFLFAIPVSHTFSIFSTDFAFWAFILNAGLPGCQVAGSPFSLYPGAIHLPVVSEIFLYQRHLNPCLLFSTLEVAFLSDSWTIPLQLCLMGTVE